MFKIQMADISVDIKVFAFKDTKIVYWTMKQAGISNRKWREL